MNIPEILVANGTGAVLVSFLQKMYFGKALGLAELRRMISQGLLHKLPCSGLFCAQALQAECSRVYNINRYCIK